MVIKNKVLITAGIVLVAVAVCWLFRKNIVKMYYTVKINRICSRFKQKIYKSNKVLIHGESKLMGCWDKDVPTYTTDNVRLIHNFADSLEFYPIESCSIGCGEGLSLNFYSNTHRECSVIFESFFTTLIDYDEMNTSINERTTYDFETIVKYKTCIALNNLIRQEGLNMTNYIQFKHPEDFK